MKYNTLGRSDLNVSEVSFGCMSLKEDNPEAPAVITKAIDLGINFFDTADLYEFGWNEELLGKVIEGKRQDLIIATKVGNEWNARKDSWSWNPGKGYILSAVEDSLSRLRTDYIDLYQLHGGTIEDPIDETIEAFELLKEQGKIREYGISSIRPNVIREYAKRSNMVSVMMQYSLLDRRPEKECLELLKKNNVSVIARGSLAKGLLIDKPAKEYLDHSSEDVAIAKDLVKRIGENSDRSPAKITTKFVLSTKPVASAVIGFRTMDQLSNLVNEFGAFELNMTEVDMLRASVVGYNYGTHV